MGKEIIFAYVLSFGGFGIITWAGLLKKTRLLSTVIALPVGVAVYTFASAFIYAAGINRPEIGIYITVIISLLGLLTAVNKKKMGPSDMQVFPYILAVVSALMLTVRYVVTPILSFDSYKFIIIGKAFGSSIFSFGSSGLLSRPLMITNFQAGGDIFNLDYVVYIPIVTGLLSIIGATLVITDVFSSSKNQATFSALIALLIMAVFGATTYMLRFSLGYLNSHMLMAGYYSLGFALCLDIGKRRDPIVHQTICALILGSVAFIRLEGLLLMSLLLIVLMSLRPYSKKELLNIGAVVLLIPGLWYSRLAIAGVSGDTILSSRNTVVMLLAVATPFVLNGLLITQQLSKYLPSISIIGLSVILTGYLLTQEKAVESSSIFLSNVLATGYWGAFWWTFGPLVIFLAIFGPRLKSEDAWLAVIGGGVLIILLLGAVRSHPYRLGWGDSGNRMLVHLAPLVVLYTLVKVRAYFGGIGRLEDEIEKELRDSSGMTQHNL